MQRVNCICCKIRFIVIALKKYKAKFLWFRLFFMIVFGNLLIFFKYFLITTKKTSPLAGRVQMQPLNYVNKFYEIKKFELWHVTSNSLAFWQEPVRLLSPIMLRISKWYSVSSLIVRLAMALIRQRVCAAWSEPLLVSQTTLLEIFIWTIVSHTTLLEISCNLYCIWHPWRREATLQGLSQVEGWTQFLQWHSPHSKIEQLTCCLRYVND